MARVHTVILAGLTLLFAQASTAQTSTTTSITTYGGYRSGGSLQEGSSPNASLDLKGNGAVSFSIDRVIDSKRQVQVFFSQQDSEFPPSGASTSATAVPLTVSYLHLGGTNFIEDDVGRGVYVVGGLGITRLSPGRSGLSAEIRPSLNLGVGYQWPLATSVALRFELRGYFTAINSNSSLFCSGGCVLRVKGDTLTQGEALLGLSVGF